MGENLSIGQPAWRILQWSKQDPLPESKSGNTEEDRKERS